MIRSHTLHNLAINDLLIVMLRQESTVGKGRQGRGV
jgi:hypothetical protein